MNEKSESRWIPACSPRIGEYADTVQRAERMRSETPASPCARTTSQGQTPPKSSSWRRPGPS